MSLLAKCWMFSIVIGFLFSKAVFVTLLVGVSGHRHFRFSVLRFSDK